MRRLHDVMSRTRLRAMASFFFVTATVCALLCLNCPAATLYDLKKLEIICFVPSYLPQGFRLKNVEITYDETGPGEKANRPLPLYSLEYGNGWSATFSIESAREGIGDAAGRESHDHAHGTCRIGLRIGRAGCDCGHRGNSQRQRSPCDQHDRTSVADGSIAGQCAAA